MKTLIMAILEKNQISMEEGMKSVKDIVLEKYPNASVVKCQDGYYINTGKNKDYIGSGRGEDKAWSDAALFIIGF